MADSGIAAELTSVFAFSAKLSKMALVLPKLVRRACWIHFPATGVNQRGSRDTSRNIRADLPSRGQWYTHTRIRNDPMHLLTVSFGKSFLH